MECLTGRAPLPHSPDKPDNRRPSPTLRARRPHFRFVLRILGSIAKIAVQTISMLYDFHGRPYL
jgi:hypothetical protein